MNMFFNHVGNAKVIGPGLTLLSTTRINISLMISNRSIIFKHLDNPYI